MAVNQATVQQQPLWRQLQATAQVVGAVLAGQSLTPSLDAQAAVGRPGIQALSFRVLRRLGFAQGLRGQLAARKPTPAVDTLLCVALALASDPEQPYAGFTLVDQTIEAAKKQPATRNQANFINACLRRYLRETEALHTALADDLLAQWNHPLWWIKRLQADYPDQWQQILQANNQAAALVLRVNPRQTSQADYLAALQAAQIDATPLGAAAIRLAQPRDVRQLPGYAQGWFSVQDPAAQLAAPLLQQGLALCANASSQGRAAPRILDACAAPGGKTAHLLELMDCQLTALDIDAQRCQRIEDNLARLRLSAQILVGDAAQPQSWWDGQAYDAILLDAPCTASGIVRRHPDVRWLRRETDLAQLAGIQARLLQTLWPLLRPGGCMVYSTCSVFTQEGQSQVQAFVANNTDAYLQAPPCHLLPQIGAAGNKLPDNPLCDNDGFFYAVLYKRLA